MNNALFCVSNVLLGCYTVYHNKTIDTPSKFRLMTHFRQVFQESTYISVHSEIVSSVFLILFNSSL